MNPTLLWFDTNRVLILIIKIKFIEARQIPRKTYDSDNDHHVVKIIITIIIPKIDIATAP